MAPSSRAKAVAAPADVLLATRLLDQAERHLASAEIDGVDLDSRFGMLYDAARKAADAMMRAEGRRVTSGSGHHVVYLDEAERLMGAHSTDWLVVKAGRSIRNDMEYRGREVTQLEADELATSARRVVTAAREYVDAKKT